MSFQITKSIEDQYKVLKKELKNAKQGEVVTRFAPEPSGYLHIGHVKAALITYYSAKIFEGKMILRFDDTNPSKEKQEYVDSIEEDLKKLGITWDKVSYTSDYFEYFEGKAVELIKAGLAYCDNTPVEQMREERTNGIASKCRENSIEENLRLFQGMKNAMDSEKLAKKIEDKMKPAKHASSKDKKPKEEDLTDYAAYCLRAKISMDNLNKCMRDPVLYRCNFTPHHRTGTKYKMYPTYDFACPLLDSYEGVTHAMRSMEYTDRVAQYEWVIKKCNVRKVNIFEFSRLGFVNVVLSKRKLQWFVDTGRVNGWDDPRVPTVRGILRRGLRVETLTEFMLAQGASRKYSLMEWDKIWAMNKKIIDPICPRYTCVKKEKVCTLTIVNGPETVVYKTHPFSPIKEATPEMKQGRPVALSKNLYIDYDDAVNISNGEKITLMKFGNVVIKSKVEKDGVFELTGEYLPDDNNFAKTQKITWLSKDIDLVLVNLIELDHLITVDKVEEDQDFESVVNDKTKFVTQYYADPLLRIYKPDDVLQFERRGYYKIDKVTLTKEGDKIIDLIFTPDGKQKAMTSNLKQEVDAKQLAQGKQGTDKGEKKKALKEQQKQSAKQTNNNEKQQPKDKSAKSAATEIFTVQGNFRGNAIIIAAEMAYQSVQVNTMQWSELKSKQNLQNNPLGQIPYIKTKEGVIAQTGACVRYFALKNPKSAIYGANDFEKSQVDQWMDYANGDLQSAVKPALYSALGWTEKLSAEALKQELVKIEQVFAFLNKNIEGKKFFVGKSATVADIMLYVFLVQAYRTFVPAEFRSKYASLTAWFEGVSKLQSVAKQYGVTRYPSQAWN